MNQLYTNKFEITIDGINYTKLVPFPIKWSNLLDEQLDEANITIIRSKRKIFKPFTLVSIKLWNSAPGKENKIKEFNMFVAMDNAVETPPGSKRYNHTLYLIEETKLLEGIFPRSHGYVNPLVRNYGNVQMTVPPITFASGFNGQQRLNTLIADYPPPDIFSPQQVGTLTFPALEQLFEKAVVDGGVTILNSGKSITITQNGNTIFETTNTNTPATVILSSAGQIEVRYNFNITYNTLLTGSLVYNIGLVSKSDVPPKYTIRTVLQRAFIVADEIRKGDSPRFSLDGDNPLYLGRFDSLQALQDYSKTLLTYNPDNIDIWHNSTAYVGEYGNGDGDNGLYVYNKRGVSASPQWYRVESGGTARTSPALSGQALEFEYINAPEFQFTQSNLREVLQGIGAFIHGEPRLKGNVIYYDMYGSGETSGVYYANYAQTEFSQNVERYATHIDSNVDNLIDSIGYAKGVRIEPYSNGVKTLRTEKTYARIEENNLFIATDRPINAVIALEWYNPHNQTYYDITPYVFESADYAQMSSYSEAYPYSKGYATYYTRGAKNVYGLNFKLPNAVSSIFSRYSVINILRAATGNSSLNIEDVTTHGDYAELAFRVTYQPMVTARVRQSRQCVLNVGEERAIAYNQGQNVIEAHYYGENLKGVIARLGNVDRTITIVRQGLADIPKVGTIWADPEDEDYYISAVAVEVNAFATKMTIALSKDFNRYSAYVNIDSQKRQYEISERAAYDSFYAYRDYCIIGTPADSGTATDNSTLIADMTGITEIFTQNGAKKPVSAVLAQGTDAQGNELQKVALSCQALPLGNAAVFTASYEDNYSAGLLSSYQSAGGVSGYFTNAVPYSDYYGRMEYLSLEYAAEIASADSAVNTGLKLPAANGLTAVNPYITTGDKPLRVSKSSTEILSVNYQIDFVTNVNNFIIGSAMAKNFAAVTGTQPGHAAKLYLLKNRINKFSLKVDLTGALETEYTLYTPTDYYNGFFIYNPTYTGEEEYAAFVFVDGTTNEVLLGGNRKITSGKGVFFDSQSQPLYFSLRHSYA